MLISARVRGLRVHSEHMARRVMSHARVDRSYAAAAGSKSSVRSSLIPHLFTLREYTPGLTACLQSACLCPCAASELLHQHQSLRWNRLPCVSVLKVCLFCAECFQRLAARVPRQTLLQSCPAAGPDETSSAASKRGRLQEKLTRLARGCSNIILVRMLHAKLQG